MDSQRKSYKGHTMKKIVFVLMLLLTLSGSHPTQAAVTNLSYSVGCSSVYVAGTTDTKSVYIEIDNANGGVLGSAYKNDPVGAALGSFGLLISFSQQQQGTVVLVYISDASGIVVNETPVACTNAAPYTGIAIPPGFVLRTVVCDTAIFDGIDGMAVANNKIKAGQTWFVSPKSLAGKKLAWTAVFVGSPDLVYIPSTCIA